jgi:predicted nucleotidyltransferase
MPTISPERPLDPLTAAILQAVDAVARRQGVPYFVCGAMARDILAWHVHGIAVPRATRDVDLAFALPDWKAFTQLKSALTEESGFVSTPENPGRLRFSGSVNSPGYPVDLIPFGGIATENAQLAWPPDYAVIMNVVGYDDALDSACTVVVETDFAVPVVSLPMLAVLKIIAWGDRRLHTVKDARDFAFLLTTYQRTVASRLYEDEISTLTVMDFDIDLAGSRLLGKDATGAVNPATRRAVNACLSQGVARRSLITEISISLASHADPIGHAESFLREFEAGFSEVAE